jgi:hypothetical protein
MSNLRLDPIQGILAILDRGNTTGTNKFGLLLSLIDLAPYVGADRRIQYQDIALKLIEIHWSHSVPYSGAGTLRQVSSGNRKNTTLIQEIEKLREGVAPNCQFEQARKVIDSSKWEIALTKISAATVKNPIDKLQSLPGSPPPFLYNVEKQTSFITIYEKALEDLIKFGPVIRDLVEFRFVHFVVKNNKKILGNTVDERVYAHLFGREREMPSLVIRKQLWELQGKCCLYTGEVLDDPALKSKQVAIDHVVPWSISKLSHIENFVVTSNQTNSSKSNLLIAPAMLMNWSEYVVQNRSQLKEVSQSGNWSSDLKQVCDVALALYTHMSEFTPVWNSKKGYEPLGLYGQSQAIDCLKELTQLL